MKLIWGITLIVCGIGQFIILQLSQQEQKYYLHKIDSLQHDILLEDSIVLLQKAMLLKQKRRYDSLARPFIGFMRADSLNNHLGRFDKKKRVGFPGFKKGNINAEMRIMGIKTKSESGFIGL